MTAGIARFVADRSGATVVEYALIASIISVALVAAAAAIGVQINGTFGGLSGKFTK